LIGSNRVNLIVGWCGRFLFFVVPRKFSLDAGDQFSQVVGEWPENQILIPDWTNFHCPDANKISVLIKTTTGNFWANQKN